MTEEEWLGCEVPCVLLERLGPAANDRKLRLCAIGCVRHSLLLRADRRILVALEVAESLADNLAVEDAVRRATADVEALDNHNAWKYQNAAIRATLYDSAFRALWVVLEELSYFELEALSETHTYSRAPLFRDIFGNPFRPITFDPAWRTSDVLALAKGIYDERAFDRMPILADALQDAGCTSDDILSHCRDTNTPHARGCWVVDLILGKS